MISLPCVERGVEIRAGVFHCAVHGECSITPSHTRVMPCSTCRDRMTDNLRAEPVSMITECIHRGPQIETVGCGSCAGQVRVKVFACEVQSIGRCQIGRKLAGVHSCDGCQSKNFRSAPTP